MLEIESNAYNIETHSLFCPYSTIFKLPIALAHHIKYYKLYNTSAAIKTPKFMIVWENQ